MGTGVAGVAGVAGGCSETDADGGTSGSGDDRDGESVGLGKDEGSGVLDLRPVKMERVDDEGCCCFSWEVPMLSEVGLVEEDDREGEGDLRLPKEVERKREGRLEGVGACRGAGRSARDDVSKVSEEGTESDKKGKGKGGGEAELNKRYRPAPWELFAASDERGWKWGTRLPPASGTETGQLLRGRGARGRRRGSQRRGRGMRMRGGHWGGRGREAA